MPRLAVGRVSCYSDLKRGCCGLEVALLELGQTKVELDTGKLGVERERLSVGGCRFGVLLLPGKNDAQAREGRGVARIVRRHGLPS